MKCVFMFRIFDRSCKTGPHFSAVSGKQESRKWHCQQKPPNDSIQRPVKAKWCFICYSRLTMNTLQIMDSQTGFVQCNTNICAGTNRSMSWVMTWAALKSLKNELKPDTAWRASVIPEKNLPSKTNYNTTIDPIQSCLTYCLNVLCQEDTDNLKDKPKRQLVSQNTTSSTSCN